jgi:hypothetical protein
MNASIYLTDFNLWAQQTALLVRERRAIASQLIRLLLHLLKWQFQPHRRSDSWLDSITDARIQIELTVQESPSLKQYPAADFFPRRRVTHTQ